MSLCAAQATQPAQAPTTESATQQATREQQQEDRRLRQAQTKREALAQLPDAGQFDLSEIVSFSLRQQTLHVRFHPPQRLQEVGGEGTARLTIKGDPGVWEFAQKHDDNTDATGPYTAFTRYDLDATLDPARFEVAAIHQRNDATTLRGQRGGARPVSVLFRLFRDPDPMMSLTVTGQRARVQNVRSVYALRRQNAQALREQLAPLLRHFRADHLLGPGATDYYRAFESIAADPQVQQQVRDLLPRLEMEPFEAREDASRELDALGTAGVLAILRMDRTTLGPEPQRRLEAHLADHAHWADEPPADAIANSDFLLEAMNFEDSQVRDHAKAAFENLTGAPVEIDLSQPADFRRAAIEQLRQAALPATQPAP